MDMPAAFEDDVMAQFERPQLMERFTLRPRHTGKSIAVAAAMTLAASIAPMHDEINARPRRKLVKKPTKRPQRKAQRAARKVTKKNRK